MNEARGGRDGTNESNEGRGWDGQEEGNIPRVRCDAERMRNANLPQQILIFLGAEKQ